MTYCKWREREREERDYTAMKSMLRQLISRDSGHLIKDARS
jgi:hypothetical protein